MPEPLHSGATAVVTGAAMVPVLNAVPAYVPQIIIFGYAVGLRADVLLAGFAGSVVAIAFFNAVPSTGDTRWELARTSWRRMWHCLACALTAGYLTPLLLLLDGLLVIGGEKVRIPESLTLSVAFVAGAGAQRILGRFIKKAAQDDQEGARNAA